MRKEQKKRQKLMILFGSYAKGTTGKRSDVDVAVFAEHPLSLRDTSELSEDIAKKFSVSEDSVDIADLSTASPLLQYEVAEHGKLLQGKPEDFFSFRLLARKRYMHAEKLYRIRDEHLKNMYEPKSGQ